MAAKNELEQLIESAVTSLGFDFVGCEMISSSRTLRVYVDEINGIDIDAISKISRQISAVLDVEDFFPGSYTLEVSSPGLDRPLFRLDDYRRFAGKAVKLRLRVPKGGEGRRNYKGILTSVEDNRITLETEPGEKITVIFDEIEKANLVPEF